MSRKENGVQHRFRASIRFFFFLGSFRYLCRLPLLVLHNGKQTNISDRKFGILSQKCASIHLPTLNQPSSLNYLKSKYKKNKSTGMHLGLVGVFYSLLKDYRFPHE